MSLYSVLVECVLEQWCLSIQCWMCTGAVMSLYSVLVECVLEQWRLSIQCWMCSGAVMSLYSVLVSPSCVRSLYQHNQHWRQHKDNPDRSLSQLDHPLSLPSHWWKEKDTPGKREKREGDVKKRDMLYLHLWLCVSVCVHAHVIACDRVHLNVISLPGCPLIQQHQQQSRTPWTLFCPSRGLWSGNRAQITNGCVCKTITSNMLRVVYPLAE